MRSNIPSAPTASEPLFRSFPLLRWGVLFLSLVAELVFLTAIFDSESFERVGGMWSSLLSYSPIIAQYAAVMATAVLIFGGRNLAVFVSENRTQILLNTKWKYYLLAHEIVFIAFVFLTSHLFRQTTEIKSWLFGVWLSTAMLYVVTFLCAVLPPKKFALVLFSIQKVVLFGLPFAVLVLIAAKYSSGLWTVLASSTFRLVCGVLFAFNIPVQSDPTTFVIGTETFAVSIAPECSGYEGIGLAIAFVSTYLFINREHHRFPQSLLILPLAICLIYFLNVLRIAALLMIGNAGWQSFALGAFHSQAGWLGFNFSVLAIVAFANIHPWFIHRPSAKRAIEKPEPSFDAIPMLIPFMILVLVSMGTSGDGLNNDNLYVLRIIAVAICLAVYRGFYKGIFAGWKPDLATTLVGVVTFFVWIGLEFLFSNSRPGSPSQVTNNLSDLQTTSIVFRILGSSLTVPIAEEFAFRGYLFAWLSSVFSDLSRSKRVSIGLALGISSIAFGMMHPGRWIAGVISGLLFGYAMIRRGRVADSVLAHSIANILINIYVVSSGDTGMWS